MTREEYEAYLLTPAWKEKREWALRCADHTCADCGYRPGSNWPTPGPKHLEVHHLNYDHVGEELVRDLLVLCDECHEIRHNEALRRRPETPPPVPQDLAVLVGGLV